jgi:hypothetical protein
MEKAMANNEMKNLLSDFGKSVGIPELTFDDTGSCMMSFDDTLVNMQMDEDTDHLYLYGLVGEIPENDRLSFYETALEANRSLAESGGAVFAIDKEIEIDKEIDALLICNKISFAGLELGKFEHFLERFVNTAEVLAGKVAARPVEEKGPVVTEGGSAGMRGKFVCNGGAGVRRPNRLFGVHDFHGVSNERFFCRDWKNSIWDNKKFFK